MATVTELTGGTTIEQNTWESTNNPNGMTAETAVTEGTTNNPSTWEATVTAMATAVTGTDGTPDNSGLLQSTVTDGTTDNPSILQSTAITPCGPGELLIQGGCVNELFIPLAAVLVFLLLLVITLVAVVIYRRLHPEKPKRTSHTPPTSERAAELWMRADSLDVPDDPPEETSPKANGMIPKYSQDNPGYENDYDYPVAMATMATENHDSGRDTNSKRLTNGQPPPAYPDYTPPPAIKHRRDDPYMSALEMSELYKGFNADLSAVPSKTNANYTIQRPKILAGSGAASVKSSDSRFSGTEMNI